MSGQIFISYRREESEWSARSPISDFNEAIKLNPNYANAYYNRGLAYSYQGKPALAQADLDKAKQLGDTGQ